MASSSANSAACASIRSASLLMVRSRTLGGRFDQRPSSNAPRAVATPRTPTLMVAGSRERQGNLTGAGSSPRSGTWPHRKRRGCSTSSSNRAIWRSGRKRLSCQVRAGHRHTCLLLLTVRLRGGFFGRIAFGQSARRENAMFREQRFVPLVLCVSLLAPGCGGSTEGVSPLQPLPAARGQLLKDRKSVV